MKTGRFKWVLAAIILVCAIGLLPQKIIAGNPYCEQGIQEFNNDQYEKAIDSLSRCLDNTLLSVTEKIKIHKLLGFSYLAFDVFYQAEKQFKNALDLDPNFNPTDDPTWGNKAQKPFLAAKASLKSKVIADKKESPAPAKTSDGMVLIPEGWFMMGCSPGDSECQSNERPSRRIFIDSFYMDVYNVTQAQYLHEIGKTPSQFAHCPKCPVDCVSWEEARYYCEKVGKRLPTEAEWEYAARGGTITNRYGYLDSIAWFNKNSGDNTHPVGQKKPNDFGLYDLLGNVWEWCQDFYDKKSYNWMPNRNPLNHKPSSSYVLRGGSWGDKPENVRVSARKSGDSGYSWRGFRCVRAVK